MGAVNKKLCVTRLDCVALRRNRDEVLLKLKVLETDLRTFLIVLSERTTEGFLVMSKQFRTEVAQGLERTFVQL